MENFYYSFFPFFLIIIVKETSKKYELHKEVIMLKKEILLLEKIFLQLRNCNLVEISCI